MSNILLNTMMSQVKYMLMLVFVLTVMKKCKSSSNSSDFKQEKFSFNADLDITRDSFQMIKSRNFGVEIHKTKTADNYQVTMFHIINPFAKEKTQNMPVVLFMSCIACSTDFYLIGGSGELGLDGKYRENGGEIVTDCEKMKKQTTGATLPLVLSSCGYDVWLGNDRSSGYSNQKIDYINLHFWNFSFVQIGRYDLPAIIDYILIKTKKENLNYIGISEAATDMFLLLSEKPDYYKKIDKFFAFGAVAYLLDPHISFKLLSLLIWRINFISFPVFPPFDPVRAAIVDIVCSNLTNNICRSLASYVGLLGSSLLKLSHFDPARFSVILSHYPQTASLFGIVHYCQLVMSKRFQYFDYGCEKNRMIYNQTNCQPPLISLERIKLKKIAIFYSAGDQFSTPKDLQALKQSLKVPLWKTYRMSNHVFHGDYVIHPPTARKVNSRVLRLLKE